ncbi:hypothetical protein FNV43_RR20421 [Rhamnella rubrinervis]|uniref:Uncharacterized protein n=1 Tax=Rhamnella rubrinervis TaxID=2594499 RepID=A0A8K0GX10_9ROSA|nr:hypothetical protein FNV43_RR20421 [Rhamnella rubrinervis]
MSPARRTNKGFPLHFVTHQLVNIRKRIEPPFSENSVGNFVQYFSVEIDNQETKTMELQDLVSLLRKGIEGLDKGEAKRLGGDHGDAAVEIFKSWKERKDLSIRDDSKLFTCTSALDFGLYEIDFGWGKPIWVSLDSGSSLNNFIMLISTRDGDGVEAWVTLSEEDMAVFELDPELLSFVSLSNLSVSLLPESRRRLSKH